MSQWGFDVSNWQGQHFPMAQATSDGFSFVFIKATEGNSYIDPCFAGNYADAQAAGLHTAAYFYQRNVPAAEQVALIERVVPRGARVIPDVEKDSGPIAITHDIVNRLRADGYEVPLVYIPRWRWVELGKPDLSGLPPLWYSVYANYNGGFASQIWVRAKAWFLSKWVSYGGQNIAVMQFTSSATVAGRHPIDASIYRGTADQLASVLGGGQPQQDEEDDDMGLNVSWLIDQEKGTAGAAFECGGSSQVVHNLWVSAKAVGGDLKGVTVAFRGDAAEHLGDAGPADIGWDHRGYWQAPDGASGVWVTWDKDASGAALIAPYLVWN
ncbi:MAG: glycoside hydrolase family 25 protein [Streptosporangiales bacterium]